MTSLQSKVHLISRHKFNTKPHNYICVNDQPTCQDGFVCFKLLSSHKQATVCEPGTFPQAAQVISQLTLRHLQHVHVGLTGDVHRVLHHTHL